MTQLILLASNLDTAVEGLDNNSPHAFQRQQLVQLILIEILDHFQQCVKRHARWRDEMHDMLNE